MNRRGMSVDQFTELQRLKCEWLRTGNLMNHAKTFREACNSCISGDSDECHIDLLDYPSEILEMWAEIYLDYAKEEHRNAENKFNEALNRFVEVD